MVVDCSNKFLISLMNVKDDEGNLESTPFMESRRIIEEDTQIKFSKPSSMESDPEDTEDSSNVQGQIDAL